MRNTLIYNSLQQNFTLSIKHLLSLMIIVFTISSSNASAQSNFDLAFGSGGKVVSSPDGSEVTFGQDYALLPDGKIIAVGGGSTSFVVARYNANGNLDTGFGTNGWSSITFADYSTSRHAVDIQPDGKIVVGGNGSKTVNNQLTTDFLIARFNADGSPDMTFDGDAKTTVSFVPELFNSPPVRETFTTLKTTNNGKIIAGGYAGDITAGGFSQFTFAKLNADGSLDTTFDGDGKLLGVRGFAFLNDMTVLPDGSFVGAGNGANNNCRVAYKHNSDGSLVWTYQNCETTPGGTGSYGIAQQPDGKLIIVGTRRYRLNVTRLDANGFEDSSFAAPFSPEGRLNSVAVMPNGKIVANYNPNNVFDGSNSFNLVRYNSDGNFDTGFGSGGIFNLAVSGGLDYGKKLIAQPDGKILIGGYSELTNPSRNYFTMARLSDSAGTLRPVLYDFDGDRRADVSVFRPADGNWYIFRSLTNSFQGSNFGIATDSVVPADYDGDGKTDIAVYRNSQWYAMRSATNTFWSNALGRAGDIAVPGDYDGDGSADVAVFRNGLWSYRRTANIQVVDFSFGANGDKPIASDYDGDGKTDYAVYRPSNGNWLIRYSSTATTTTINFGLSDDVPVPADYDGDGKTDIAVFRPSAGDWYWLNSSNGAFSGVHWGANGDNPVPADYDGDGKADVGVFRPSDGTWYINQSTVGFKAVNWGISTDIPTVAAYNR